MKPNAGSGTRAIMSYFRDARGRAGRRRSGWNLLLIPASLIPWLSGSYYASRLLSRLYGMHHPDVQFALIPDSPVGIPLAILPLMALISPSLIMGNLIVWLIPWARDALDNEAGGHSGASFAEANAALLKFTACLSLPCLALALLVATLM